MLGEFKGSGFKETPYLIRRSDGQVIQLPELLYRIAENCDGKRSMTEVARAAGDACRVELAPEDTAVLVEKKLAPLGVLAAPDGSAPKLEKPDPFLALKMRAKLIPDRVVRVMGSTFRPLLFPAVILAVISSLAALDWWLFTKHGVAQSIRHTLYEPGFILVALGFIAVSAAMHEWGHASACLKGGAKPGAMGAGLYIVWPVFYTDVTDAYRLGRGGRLLTDFGGVYFNAIFVLAIASLYWVTGWEALIVIILLQHLEMLHQFLPFVRLDGYYMVSDLTGVPDLFSRIKPILASLLPWRRTDDRVRELKTWARVVVTLWVLVIIPVLLYVFGTMIIHMPRLFATAWDSLENQWDTSQAAFGDGNVLEGSGAIALILLLLLPLIAMPLTLLRVGKRLGGAAWRATDGKPVARLALVVGLAAVIGFVAFMWRPGPDYEPIGPNERGTLQESVASFRRIPRGDAALVPAERAQQGTAAAPTPTPSPGTAEPSPTPETEESEEPSPEPSPTESPTPTTSPTS